MQIKQAAKLTALTERAIRLYEERGLIAPDVIDKNGRNFRDYSDETVSRLKTISALRRALYTIDEIKEMLDDPARIPAITEENCRRVREDSSRLSYLLSRLESVDTDSVRNAGELSRALFAAEETKETTEREYDDGREIYAEQYRDIYDKYFSENTGWDRLYSTSLGLGGVLSAVRGFFSRRAVRICLIVLAAALVLAAVLPNVASIEKFSRKYYGGIYTAAFADGALTTGEETGETFGLAFKGSIKRYLFRDTYLDGEFNASAIKNASDPFDSQTFAVSGNYSSGGREDDDIYKSSLFLAETPGGDIRVCELYTTGTFRDVIIIFYHTETKPFADGGGDAISLHSGQYNSYYYRLDEDIKVAMLKADNGGENGDDGSISKLLYRVSRALNDMYSDSYVLGFSIK